MHRRDFLALTMGAIALVATRTARASSRMKSVTRDARGTTIAFDLDHAPFPAPNAGYKDATVFVFVPAHFRYSKREQLATLVHFHGHSTTAERAMLAHELREQLYDSKQNAILVVPQGPVNASDSSCGKLEQPGGLARMLADVVDALQDRDVRSALAATAIPASARVGTVCLSAHSGGYHAAAQSLRHGGHEVTEVYLFDALYADYDAFKEWTLAGKGKPQHERHKIVSYFTEGGTTAFLSRQLSSELSKQGVRCESEKVEGTLSKVALTKAEAVFIHSGSWHNHVTWETNALRDCLYASAMMRHLRTSWFDRKDEARSVERRR
jgi:hypothetical protein